MQARVMVSYSGSTIECLKFSITCENDLFMHYSLICNQSTFEYIRSDSSLDIQFHQFADLIKKLILQVKNALQGRNLEQKNLAFAELDMGGEHAEATLSFFIDSEFKLLTLLRVVLQLSDEEDIKTSVSFKIHANIQKKRLLEQRLQNIMGIVETANPLLHNHIKIGIDVAKRKAQKVRDASQRHPLFASSQQWGQLFFVEQLREHSDRVQFL